VTDVISTEQLLADWRRLARELEEHDPFLPGRADLESRVEAAKTAYQEQVDRLNGVSSERTTP
jgi:hypothetical protein